MNNKSGVFLTWFQNFAMLVFNQSLHAVFMVFVLKMMSAVATDAAGNYITDRTNGILAIVSIAGAQALIKLEKVIKDMFGIGDSKYMGNLKQNMAKTMAAVGSGINMAKRTAEPIKGTLKSHREIRKLEKAHPELKKGGVPTSSTSSTPASAASTENNEVANTTNVNQTNENNSQNTTAGNSTGKLTDLIAALNNNTNALTQNTGASEKGKEENIYKQYEELKAARSENAWKSLFRTATTVAATGVGMGATDEFSEAVTVANLVDIPLDKISDRGIEKAIYKDRTQEIGKELAARERELDEINRKNAKAAPAQKVDTSNLEKAIKDLKETKIAMDDKVPANLRRELADLWKDVKVEVAPSTTVRRIKNSAAYDRDKRNNVDDI